MPSRTPTFHGPRRCYRRLRCPTSGFSTARRFRVTLREQARPEVRNDVSRRCPSTDVRCPRGRRISELVHNALSKGIRDPVLPEVPKHQFTREHRGKWVSDTIARTIERAPMYWLKHRRELTVRIDIRRRCRSETARDIGTQIGQDAPKEIRCDDNVELVRSTNDRPRALVNKSCICPRRGRRAREKRAAEVQARI